MCGINGFWQTADLASTDDLTSVVSRMADSLRHRGPDDSGAWVDASVGIAFGHRRLSILDLSPAGHQPMHSSRERFVIAFNGEIYNHLSIRADLAATGAAPDWKGHSDTETLLAAIEYWGLDGTLQRCVGMFAIALYDRHNQTLSLARDRFGEKPLYYGWSNKAFLFGSELKALRAYPGFDAPICREALAQYLRFMYVPAPRSIYTGVCKLEPGCMLVLKGNPPATPPSQPLRPGQSYEQIDMRRWWSLAETIESAHDAPFVDDTEAIDALETQLSDSIRMQLLSDVPLGAFLSGGVDSSTIVALMQRQSSRPVKTFTIGFDEPGYDEAPYAAAVARHLGTEHHEMRVTSQMAQDVIHTLPHMYDEPFADSSQIPTYLVCQSARQQVTVALSGDAGDELFGGYNRYFWGPRIWNRLAWMPDSSRRALGYALSKIPTKSWDTIGSLTGIGTAAGGVVLLGDKVQKLSTRLRTVKTMDDLYRSLVSEWTDPSSVVLGVDGSPALEPSSLLDDPLPAVGVSTDQLRMMFWDSITYLPDDILCKVDRAAMACSLETRVPFLDHRVAELAWRLPLHMKIRGNVGKWALRQVLYRHVPRELIERPKAGFAIPIGQWLRGPLRAWAEELLDPSRLQAEGYFRPEPIQNVWKEHLSGRYDHTPKLWAILMFQSWHQQHKPRCSDDPLSHKHLALLA